MDFLFAQLTARIVRVNWCGSVELSRALAHCRLSSLRAIWLVVFKAFFLRKTAKDALLLINQHICSIQMETRVTRLRIIRNMPQDHRGRESGVVNEVEQGSRLLLLDVTGPQERTTSPQNQL
ncbi:hypothetical protein Tco_0356036 [Tanacetum coccineum]